MAATAEKPKLTIRGDVIMQDDPRYEAANRPWARAARSIKSLFVVHPLGVSDVQATLAYVRANNLSLVVRGGGHSVPGRSSKEGAVLLSFARMRGVCVDAATRTAWVQAGATTADLDHEAAVYNLFGAGGNVSSTGITGFTVHGGFSLISRRYGMAVDNILAARIVLPDGTFLEADATHNADLFWSVCGGGAFVGVITELKIQLFPIPSGSPNVYGGIMFFNAEEDATFRALMTTAAAVHRTVKSDAAFYFLVANPPPFGRKRTMVVFSAFLGDGDMAVAETGLKAYLAPLLAMNPMHCGLGATPYPKLNATLDAFFPDGPVFYFTSITGPKVTDATLAHLFEMDAKRPAFQAVVFETWGAKIGEPIIKDSILSLVNARHDTTVLMMGELDDAATQMPVMKAYTSELKRELAKEGFVELNYINYSDRAASDCNSGAARERLLAVKAKYDPTGMMPMP